MNSLNWHKIFKNPYVKFILNLMLILFVLYLFLLSIKLMGTSFKMFGKEFTENIIAGTSNPLVALFIGILATSLIQSSSTTTSLVVGLVASGTFPLANAIPIIMGANIGTTVTNTIVSMAHITRKLEFKKAEKLSSVLARFFVDFGGAKLFNPLSAILNPVIDLMKDNINIPAVLFAISIVLMFTSLIALVKIMRGLIITKAKILLDYYLFKNDRTSFGVGVVITTIVQSSSISTAIIVPMVGSGLLTIRQIFPYTLGANIGTTTTAMMASMATANPIAITVGFVHLLFNVFGIIIIYPFRSIPIRIAEFIAEFAARSKKNTLVFVTAYCSAYLVPIIIIIT